MIAKYLARSEPCADARPLRQPDDTGASPPALPAQGTAAATTTASSFARRCAARRVAADRRGRPLPHVHLRRRPLKAAQAARPQGQFPDYAKKVLARHGIGDRPMVAMRLSDPERHAPIPRRARPGSRRSRRCRQQPHLRRRWHIPVRDVRAQLPRAVLGRSDIVLANCDPVADSMGQFTTPSRSLPNACELRARPRRKPAST